MLKIDGRDRKLGYPKADVDDGRLGVEIRPLLKVFIFFG
jgi:hypothetical protein